MSTVRTLFFVTDLPMFLYDPDEGSIASNPKAFALIWTYPLINFIVISYTVSSHWVYDLMTIMHANQAPLVLRNQMKVFVVAIVFFVIIMYLVYMLSLPQHPDKEELPQIFFYLAIFEWLVAAILFISIFLYVKRISSLNAVYGRAVAIEAVVFITANVLAGIFNYFMSKGFVNALLEARVTDRMATFSIVMIPYFCVTEFLPSIVFAQTMNIFYKALSDETEEIERLNV